MVASPNQTKFNLKLLFDCDYELVQKVVEHQVMHLSIAQNLDKWVTKTKYYQNKDNWVQNYSNCAFCRIEHRINLIQSIVSNK